MLNILSPVHTGNGPPATPGSNIFLRLHWHSVELAPHHLRELNNWLGRLIGFPLPHMETGYLFSGVPCYFVFLSAMSLQKGG